jgi:hypothetical protein
MVGLLDLAATHGRDAWLHVPPMTKFSMLGWSKERNEEKREEYERAISLHKKEDIVYVDESGIDRHLHRRNARSAKGKEGVWLCGWEEISEEEHCRWVCRGQYPCTKRKT